VAEDLISGVESVWDINIQNTDFMPDTAELDWYIQKLSGEAANEIGYQGVALKDEHGTSYMVNMLGKEKDLMSSDSNPTIKKGKQAPKEETKPEPKDKILSYLEKKMAGRTQKDWDRLGKIYQEQLKDAKTEVNRLAKNEESFSIKDKISISKARSFDELKNEISKAGKKSEQAAAEVKSKANVGDIIRLLHNGSIVNVTSINDDGTVNASDGISNYYSQDKYETATQQDRTVWIMKTAKELRKQSAELRKQASEYNKETDGRAVNRKGKVEIVKSRVGGGVEIIPFAHNRESTKHKELIDSANKALKNAKTLEDILTKKPKSTKQNILIKKIKSKRDPGRQNTYSVINIPKSILDLFDWKRVWYIPGQPQEVYSEMVNGDNNLLFKGSVTDELIPFLKEELSKQPKAEPTSKEALPVFKDKYNSGRQATKDLNAWLDKNIKEGYAIEDTGDEKTFGYYNNQVVFPLKDGRKVYTEVSDDNTTVTVKEVKDSDITPVDLNRKYNPMLESGGGMV